MKKTALLCSAALVLGLSVPRPAKAQFGADIVYLIQLVQQGLQLYQLEQQTQLILQNAQYYFTGGIKNQWRGLLNQMTIGVPQNTAGETSVWGQAMATGQGAIQAWARANYKLADPAVAALTPRGLANLASIETIDAGAANAIQAHGESVAHQQKMAVSIQNLQTAVADGTLGTNSEVQQLNLLANGTMQGLEMQQTQNRSALAALELQTAQAKIERDHIADHLQFNADMDLYAKQGIGLGNVAASIQGWQLK